jgi:chemotaxis response regulator CheB
MRIGIATKNGTQAGIMVELLEPLFGQIRVYDEAALNSGDFLQCNEHALIIDYSVESIMEMDCIGEMLGRDEPKSILSERQLHPLQHDERLAWRKKIVAEVRKLLPDLAHEINTSKENAHGHDIWVIGSSSGGPDALTTFLSALPRLPISLLIAQHIASGDGSMSLLKVLNNRQAEWLVEIAADGMQMRPGRAYIVPRDTVVSVEGERLTVREARLMNPPSPSINATLRAVRRSATGGVGVVILTGQGDDGTAALKEIKHKTIMVLAQEASECASRSMPDAARQAGVVDATDYAAGIARRIATHYDVSAQ